MDWQAAFLIVLTAFATTAAPVLIKAPSWLTNRNYERARAELYKEQTDKTLTAKDAELTMLRQLNSDYRAEILRLERRVAQLEATRGAAT